MAVDSNMPYNRVNVQSNNNDTIWNGAAYGAGAGIGAAGLTYGATMHGARGLSQLNYKAAGNKTIREMTRSDKRAEKGKIHKNNQALDGMAEYRMDKADAFSQRMGKVEGAGTAMFGSKRRAIGTIATGAMGGLLGGAITDHYK